MSAVRACVAIAFVLAQSIRAHTSAGAGALGKNSAPQRDFRSAPMLCGWFVLGAFLALAPVTRAQSIFSIAGGGSDDGRPATVAALSYPYFVAVDPSGDLYIADDDQHRIRKVDARAGIITTVAGNGAAGFQGDGGPASAASFGNPMGGIAVSPAGDLYIADTDNDVIRKVAAGTGIITTVVGTGTHAFFGDGGPATLAALKWPSRVTFDPSGNLYITDLRNHRIRKVDAGTGIITTVAGNGEEGYSGDGGPARMAALDLSPKTSKTGGVAVDRTGNVYIADTDNNRIRQVSAETGLIRTIAGNGEAGFSGDGGPATQARLNGPHAVALLDDSDVLVVDTGNLRIRKVALGSGLITTVAGGGRFRPDLGDGGPATEAHIGSPTDAGVDRAAKSFFIADLSYHRIRRVATDSGMITTVAGNGEYGFTGDGGPATAAGLYSPRGIVLDPSGNLYVAEFFGNRVRKVATETGMISRAVGTGFPGFGGEGGVATAARISYPKELAMDITGNLYIADTLNHRVRKVAVGTAIITTLAGNGSSAFSGDGGPATQAALNTPVGVSVDNAGNLYIADRDNQRVRKVDATTGIIVTFAGNGEKGFSGDGGPATSASLNEPEGLAIDSFGTVYIADERNKRVREVDPVTGTISTVAGNGTPGSSGDGGLAREAQLLSPSAVAVDLSGDLYIADYNRVRKVTAATGIITTVAGGRFEFAGDGGPATAAGLRHVESLAFDASGNLYIADSSNDRIRVVYRCVTVSAPQFASPSDGSLGVFNSPRLAWNAVRGAFRYDVYLDTVNPPEQIVASDIATATFAPANLEPLAIYYWRVVAKGDPFCIPFSTNASPVRSFTTAASCTAPGSFELSVP